MKILIVSKLFNPENSIGAVRTYNFATELSLLGYKTFVLTSDKELMTNVKFPNNMKVFYVPSGRIEKKREEYIRKSISTKDNSPDNNSGVSRKKKLKFIGWLRKTVAQAWSMFGEYEWYIIATKQCLKIIGEENISLLFTSYGPISNLLIGLDIKKKFQNIRWISDMRDPVDSIQQQLIWRINGARVQNKMLKSSDVIVTVCDGISNKYRSYLKVKKYVKPVYTLPNGYRDEPILNAPTQDGILRIVYTGQLYNGYRDMSELFRCIQFLENKYHKQLALEIHYAGNDGKILLEQADKYGVEKYIIDYGKLDKQQALRLQENADVLCVLSWNTIKEQGVLTGKFPEYLRLKKTVLAIVTGDLANSELKHRIEKLNIGFTYEQVNSYDEFYKLCDWIEQCLNRKTNKLSLIDNIKVEEVESYSYKHLVKKLDDILNMNKC